MQIALLFAIFVCVAHATETLPCTPGIKTTVSIFAKKSVAGAQIADPNFFVQEVNAVGINATELIYNGERKFDYTYGIDLSAYPANWSPTPMNPFWKFVPGVGAGIYPSLCTELMITSIPLGIQRG